MLLKKIIKMKIFLFVLFSIFFMPAYLLASETVFKINTSIKPPFSDKTKTGFFDILLRELFNRLEIPFEIVRLPSERAMVSINGGISDGELPRVSGLSNKYKNIIQVDEKILDYQFVAFSQPDIIQNISFESIKSKRVGIIIGWKIYEQNTLDYPNLMKVAYPIQLFKMLKVKHLDVVLYEKYAGQFILKTNGFKNIYECSPSMVTKPMFLYVNQKHKDKIPRIIKALKSIKTDGTYHKILLKTLDFVESDGV